MTNYVYLEIQKQLLLIYMCSTWITYWWGRWLFVCFILKPFSTISIMQQSSAYLRGHLQSSCFKTNQLEIVGYGW